jgi:hypothetical protein
VLLVVGYGFGDEHINGILRQALRGSPDKRLVAVTWLAEENEAKFRSFVCRQLELQEGDQRLVLKISTAKKFLGEELSLSGVSQYFPPGEMIFEEVKPTA